MINLPYNIALASARGGGLPQTWTMRQRHTGFTLIEVMVSLVVFGILSAVAAPQLINVVKTTRLTGQIDQLNTMLNYARNMALSQNVPVKLCPVGSPGATACGSNWAAGQMVVTAPTAAGATPTLLQTYTAPATVTMSSNQNSVTFTANGLATTSTRFVICDNRGSTYGRSAVVYTTGFVQTAKAGIAAWNGGALPSCSLP